MANNTGLIIPSNSVFANPELHLDRVLSDPNTLIEDKFLMLGKLLLCSYQQIEQHRGDILNIKSQNREITNLVGQQEEEITHLNGEVQGLQEDKERIKQCFYGLKRRETAREAALEIKALESKKNFINFQKAAPLATGVTVAGTVTLIAPLFAIATVPAITGMLSAIATQQNEFDLEIEKIDKDIWILTNFPEAMKNNDLKGEIDSYFEKYIQAKQKECAAYRYIKEIENNAVSDEGSDLAKSWPIEARQQHYASIAAAQRIHENCCRETLEARDQLYSKEAYFKQRVEQIFYS